MVKKVNGPKGKKVGSTKSVATEKIDSVKSVKKATAASRSSAIGGKSTALSQETREKIHELVREEADKLFKEGKIAPGKRQQVEEAVKMAIDAGILDEEIES